ncbi:transcriptional regulator of RNA polII, SAGA, subunit-domain-containing protein [Hypoxylon cercidicola]|nr:transcriptional regulator of RNA polII, SAGA, subunit-domain-containing protein [Hypoxylon cercidicola]
MPDIDPAALSRPSVNLSTPTLKSITVSAPVSQKVTKTSQIIPARIDLEPLYTALKSAIGNEQWNTYKEATTQFIIGRLNQAEFSERVDPILYSSNGDKCHLHNQLLAAIYGNLTREMPDQGVAPWVSANDKPTPNVGAKPVTGDAAERRLKREVMQLLARDRRRLKELNHNDPSQAEFQTFFDRLHTEQYLGRGPRVADTPQSANDLNKMNWDLEIRKRFAQPLAVESGEFPDVATIESRMLPICHQNGLHGGHAPDAAQFMTVAAETCIKEVLSTVFSRTKSNGPGDSGSAGFGSGTSWIQTHKYRRQLVREEGALSKGEVSRDKSGLLPVEAKAASERSALSMADLRLALEIGDCGVNTMPILRKVVMNNYRDGELENYDSYSWLHGFNPRKRNYDDFAAGGVNGGHPRILTNGGVHAEAMEIDDELTWEGADPTDASRLDNVLDVCLAVP